MESNIKRTCFRSFKPDGQDVKGNIKYVGGMLISPSCNWTHRLGVDTMTAFHWKVNIRNRSSKGNLKKVSETALICYLSRG